MRVASQPALIARSRLAARATATAAAGLGVLGAIGWLTGNTVLQAFIPGRPVMTPNTAGSLLLLAAGVHLQTSVDASPLRRAGAKACALIVLAIAGATLVYHGTGAETQIDRALSSLLPSGAEVPLPFRSAVTTALCLVLLATGLLLFDARWGRWRRPAEAPVIAAVVVVLTVLTGHAYDAQILFRFPPVPLHGTSLPAALGMALVAASILLARPDRGIMATITSVRVGGAMVRRLFLPALVGPALLGFIVLVAVGVDSQSLSLSHALLATASATVAVGLTLLTATSLNRLDEARALVADELRLWRDVVDQADDAIIVKTQDDVVIGWNPAAERLLGWRRHEIIGRSVYEIIPEDRRDELAMFVERLGRGERLPAYETLRVAKDGTLIAVTLSLATIRDLHGELVGMAAIVRDLRERKTAERRYADLFEHASDGIFIAEPSGLIEEVNAAGCRLLARPCEEVVGRAIQEFIPAEDAARLVASREALLRGAVEVGDWQLVTGDGARIPVEASATIRDGRWQLFVRDLRARKAAEVALARLYREEARAKTWLQGVLDGMPEAVLLVDAEGRLSHNKAAGRFIAAGDGAPGFDLREADGTAVPWHELPLMRALEHGETCSGRELVAHDAHAGRVPVLVSASPLDDGNGRRVGAVSVLRDISALKEMERLREEWTAIVAHDLRQPLSVISMSTQTLVRLLAPESESTAGKALGRIRGAIERLSRMIRDLYDAARLDARRLTLEREPVDLRALLAEVAARSASDGARPIRVELPESLPPVLADACRVEQIMENLLSNALKYGEPRAPVFVTAEVQGGMAIVSTHNRGPGLTPEEIGHLFTRFYRAHSDGRTEGLGLGLYITKGLVEAQGGRIWAESAAGETSFHFTLPLADDGSVPQDMLKRACPSENARSDMS